MLKFLRKYNKFILAIGGTILMVAFLLPDAIHRLSGDPMKRAVASFDGGQITESELQAAQRELEALKSVDPMLPAALLQVKDREHWLLLTREAEEGGFVGGAQDGKSVIGILAQAMAQTRLQQLRRAGQNVTQEQYNTLARQATQVIEEKVAQMAIREHSEEGIGLALARARGVLRMYDEHLEAVMLSRPEAIAAGKRYFDSVTVDYAAIPASIIRELTAASYEPTEEQIKGQFEKYKNIRPGEGEHGFGYLQPAAVKLEWLKVEKAKIAAGVKLDPVKVYTHWQQNQGRYGNDFATAKAKVETELKTEAVDRAMADIERIVQGELIKGQRGLGEDGRFKKLPEDWATKQPDYEKIMATALARMGELHGVSGSPAIVMKPEVWNTEQTLTMTTDIGQSRMVIGPNSVPFIVLAFSVRELNPESPYGLQVGVSAGPTRDAATGDLFFFRVAAAQRESPPESAEKIRGQIVGDLQRVAAYEALIARSKTLLDAAVGNFRDTCRDNGGNIVDGVRVRRDAMDLEDGAKVDASFDTEAVREAIMSRAESLDPTVEPTELDPEARTLAIPLPRSLSLALVRIKSIKPLSIEAFRVIEPSVSRDTQQLYLSGADWPFNAEAMALRHNLKRTTHRGGDEAEESEAKPATGASVPKGS